MGSNDGQVRMYSDKNVGQIAKTAIPGLGLPITAIDATYDGAWVLATTDKYLMVINASFKVCLGCCVCCLAPMSRAAAAALYMHAPRDTVCAARQTAAPQPVFDVLLYLLHHVKPAYMQKPE